MPLLDEAGFWAAETGLGNGNVRPTAHEGELAI